MTADSFAEAAALRAAEPRRLPRAGREPALLHSSRLGGPRSRQALAQLWGFS